MLLRAEVNALTRILLEAKLVDENTLTRVIGEEAEYLSQAYERKFPGAKAIDEGMDFDVQTFAETQRQMGFPA